MKIIPKGATFTLNPPEVTVNKLPLLRMVVPVFLAGFEDRNLAVLGAGLVRGSRLVVDGNVLEPNGGKYVLIDNSKRVVVVRLRRRFLDPVPDLEVRGERMQILPPIRWYEQVWMSIASPLIYLNVPLGIFCALLGYWINTRVFRSYIATWVKYAVSGVISLLVATFFFLSLFGYMVGVRLMRERQMEADLNASDLREIHEAHPKNYPSSVPDSSRLVDQSGSPRKHMDRLRLVGLLRRMEFRELTIELQGLESAYERDFRTEALLEEGFDAFAINDTTLEQAFDLWVSRMPGSVPPYLARATFCENLGWESRGYKWAKDTSPEQFEKMEKYFERTEQDVRTALSLRPGLLVAFTLLMRIASARGDHEAEEFLTSRALEICPYSFTVRQRHILNLLPRWGGSYHAMELFANQSEAYAEENPRLKVLRGYIDWDMGRGAESEGQTDKAVAFYTSALRYGPAATFVGARGGALALLGQYDGAMADMRAALAMSPYDVRILTGYVRAAYHAGADDEAMRALTTAIQLDPRGYDVGEARKYVIHDLIGKGFELHKVRNDAEALNLYKRALLFDPEDAETYYYQGVSLLSKGGAAEAEGAARRAVALSPFNMTYNRYLNYLLAQRGEWNEVIANLDKIILAQPNNGEAYLDRSKAFFSKGDPRASLRDADMACKLGQREGCTIATSLKEKGITQ